MNSNVRNALNETEMYDKKCLLADFLNRYYIYEIEGSELPVWEKCMYWFSSFYFYVDIKFN